MTDFDLLAQTFLDLVKKNEGQRLIYFCLNTVPHSSSSSLFFYTSQVVLEQYGKQYCNNECFPQKVAFEYAKNCSEDTLNNSTNDFYTETMSLFAQKFPKPEDYDSNYSYLTCSILFCTYIASQICGLYEKAEAVFNDESFFVQTSGTFFKNTHIVVCPDFDDFTPLQIAEKGLISPYMIIATATYSTEFRRKYGKGDIYVTIPSVWNKECFFMYENYKWKDIKKMVEAKSNHGNMHIEAFCLFDELVSYIGSYNYRKKREAKL